MKERIQRLVARAQATRPARVWSRYAAANGPLLANGMAYLAVFAVFAGVFVVFAILGLWLRGDSPLRNAIVDTIADAVPGLIDQGEGGAIGVDQLLSVQVLGWTGALAAVGLVWTVIGWFGASRAGVRAMLGQLAVRQNAILLKLKDAALALGFGLALVVSATLSIFSTSLLGLALDWMGIGEDAPIAVAASRIVAFVLLVLVDAGILWGLYAVLSATRLPFRAMAQGAIGGAVVLAAIQALGGLLLGGATSNPLLASFAVIIGILIWFNLLCMVLLLAAAWIGETATPTVAASADEDADDDAYETSDVGGDR